ncbi:MAG: histidine kinase [Bacteroides sp.]|nr:histidine kinase [Bacteroides sp.]
MKNREAMKLPYNRYLPEQLLYLVIWLIVFLAPVVAYAFIFFSGGGETFNWRAVYMLWERFLPFLLIFLVNNYLLAPYLLFRNNYLYYILSAVCLVVVVFSIFSFSHRPPDNKSPRRHAPEEMRDRIYDRKQPPSAAQADSLFGERPLLRGKGPGRGELPPGKGPVPSRFAFMFINLLIAILLIGFNVAVRQFFKSVRDEAAMRDIERHRLQMELEYLKYQISPHFFMNTLNNIHALMDMDVEKAKKTILELSKMMRYLLYESSHKYILLLREVQFLNNYIELMKIRYTEKVCVETSLPAQVPEIRIPPLLFISFVENAFRHGVGYRNHSYISVSLRLEEEHVVFHCVNTIWEKAEEQHQGIGLENIRKRLKLLYGNNYTLSIQDHSGRFEVLLMIPVQP